MDRPRPQTRPSPCSLRFPLAFRASGDGACSRGRFATRVSGDSACSLGRAGSPRPCALGSALRPGEHTVGRFCTAVACLAFVDSVGVGALSSRRLSASGVPGTTTGGGGGPCLGGVLRRLSTGWATFAGPARCPCSSPARSWGSVSRQAVAACRLRASASRIREATSALVKTLRASSVGSTIFLPTSFSASASRICAASSALVAELRKDPAGLAPPPGQAPQVLPVAGPAAVGATTPRERSALTAAALVSAAVGLLKYSRRREFRTSLITRGYALARREGTANSALTIWAMRASKLWPGRKAGRNAAISYRTHPSAQTSDLYE
mmetsp:Transcript_58370/g.162710  ORF Transcript_58370/g.162710 Transcript_58370/m.162710 type:complete len:323 (-) Transcript_58370:677-1645(-)